ncbi:hypothetical protein Dvina_01425 [Dactylosporangium vinaceum]|uniref:Uncharacterized protein n=1 Tax=Dactylosporangium vinaceum TaxID=53362 RepID=A0ABV5MLN0_9ACTN|nr:hypothetical protein [Dactylosporangium vinaceum]UAB96919.1 hypothetical protein Dvina_01425 [Dactylosporangium vinaceum]
MSAGEVITGVVLGLAVNEMCDVSPWLASRIIPVAARLWTRDPDRREVLAEDWSAVIHQRPGKLLKLAMALSFLGGGAVSAARFWLSRFSNVYAAGTRLVWSGSIFIKTFAALLVVSFAAIMLSGKLSDSGSVDLEGIAFALLYPAILPLIAVHAYSKNPWKLLRTWKRSRVSRAPK